MTKIRIYDINQDWLGRQMRPVLYAENKSFLFIHKDVWKLKITGPANQELLDVFEEIADVRPFESYDLSVFRSGIPRGKKQQFQQGQRYRICKSPAIREGRPFQQVHLPDDAGCYSALPLELHFLKTFFAKHDEDINFWWSPEQDVWVFWSAWFRWVIDHSRPVDEVLNPGDIDYAGLATKDRVSFKDLLN